MTKRLIGTLVIGVLLALSVAVSALAKPETIRVGNLFLVEDGGISPMQLPMHSRSPIAAHLKARFGTSDGSHFPAIRSVIADFDKTILVNARGIPTCGLSQLEARTTAQAKRACPNAIIGSGEGEVEVEFPESNPFSATSPVVFFNGGVHGDTTLLLIHAYVAVPAPTAVIATAKLTRIHRGHFGIHAVAHIPAIAGGAGSVTKFNLTIDRKFTYKGKEASYLTASCPTGHYFAGGKIGFADGTFLNFTHVLPCTPIR